MNKLQGIIPCSWCGDNVDEFNNYAHVSTGEINCFDSPTGRAFIDPLEYQFPWRNCIIERQTMGDKEYFDLSKRNKFEEFVTEIIGNFPETERVVKACFINLAEEMFSENKIGGTYHYRNVDDPGRVERYRITKIKEGMVESLYRDF